MRGVLVVGRDGGGRDGSPVMWGDERGAVGVQGRAILRKRDHSVSGGSGRLREGGCESSVCEGSLRDELSACSCGYGQCQLDRG